MPTSPAFPSNPSPAKARPQPSSSSTCSRNKKKTKNNTTDTRTRRRRHNTWMQQIMIICKVIPECDEVFKDYPAYTETNDALDTALCNLVWALSDKYVQNRIERFRSEGGFAALRYLQIVFAQSTSNDRHRSCKKVTDCMQFRDEKASKYISRFQTYVADARRLGKEYDDALGTRGDIIFIINKLAKACVDPGRKDYDALLWLLGYLRAEPAWGSKYCSNPIESPIQGITTDLNLPKSEIIVFTDASWQDCPDTGRSTSGFLIFYHGGVIEANSSLQIPVAMSSCEAEVMGAASGCMAAAHLHMLLYDMKHLGTKSYNNQQLALPNPPTVLLVDNQAACKMSLNDKLTKHTRHISRRYHFVREGQKLKLHNIAWCPSNHMVADITTKTQVATKINPHRDRAYFRLPKHMEK